MSNPLPRLRKASSIDMDEYVYQGRCLYRAYVSSYRSGLCLDTVKVSILFDRHRIIATTPKGVWVSNPSASTEEKWKWVSSSARKRYAYPTKRQAVESLLIRKKKHIAHMESSILNYKCAVEAMEEALNV